MAELADNDKKDYAKASLIGAMYLTGLRWSFRFIGLISISISARILKPEDFGIHSSVAILAGLFTMLQYGGVQEFLVKEKSVDAETLNNAWTVRLIIAGLVALMILAISPFSGAILNEPRVPAVMAVYAFLPLAEALTHPGLMVLLRDMKYSQLFRVRLIERFILTGSLLTSVLIVRTYWGITIGALAGATLFAIFSHFYWRASVQLTLTKAREIRKFAQLNFVRILSEYFTSNSDSLAARQIMGSDTFGGYHNGKELAKNLVAEIAQPAGTALFPIMSRLRDEPERFANAAARGFGAICILTALLSGGLFLTAHEVVLILLGDQWGFAAPYLKLAAFLLGLSAIYNTVNFLFVSLNRQDVLAKLMVGRAVAAVGICIIALRADLPPEGLLYAIMTVFALSLIVHFIVISRLANLGGRMVLAALRPLISATFMIVVTLELTAQFGLNDLPLIVSAAAKGVTAGVIYLLVLMALWLIMGRPRGPETALLERLGISEEKLGAR